VRIKIERSGGITGIPISSEFDAKDLPITLLSKLKKIMQNSESGSLAPKKAPFGAADHYTYKISIKEGNKVSVMTFDQYNMIDELKSLVKYAEKKDQ
jgi:hypothetical protein